MDELKERYEGRIEFSANKWTALRKLQDELEQRDFTAEEVQLLGAIIIDIINKHGGSKEEVFRALYKGYNL